MLTLGSVARGVEPALVTQSDSQRESVQALVRTVVGRYLSPEDPSTSLTIEPLVRFRLADRTTLDLSTQIDRPFDGYRNFSVPKARTSLTRELSRDGDLTTRGILSVTALDLDTWNTEGFRFRNAVAAEGTWRALPWLLLRVGLGPWLQLSKYDQRSDGREFPRFGLNERVSVYVPLGRVLLEGHLILDQAKVSGWRNEYTTAERASYRFLPQLSAGVAHELLTSAIDDETGLAQPLRIASGRESRVSIFAEWRL